MRSLRNRRDGACPFLLSSASLSPPPLSLSPSLSPQLPVHFRRQPLSLEESSSNFLSPAESVPFRTPDTRSQAAATPTPSTGFDYGGAADVITASISAMVATAAAVRAAFAPEVQADRGRSARCSLPSLSAGWHSQPRDAGALWRMHKEAVRLCRLRARLALSKNEFCIQMGLVAEGDVWNCVLERRGGM
ncbi:hypothetical protein R5R35_008596 [Gryllus longicercus]|uniref:Uncharacterized protein n=1 Tax=Gryllus longicercus TaxID=2509291 RepID=A0AAN9YX01_9ORTH